MQRIPPQVSLRAIREARGLTSVTLAAEIKERGIKVDPDYILAVELGRRRASNHLLIAWANALHINRWDIRQGKEVRELVGEDDEDAKTAESAA